MSFMSVRELNSNVSRALAAAADGEDIVLTRKGKPFLRITRDGVDDAEAKRAAARARLREMMETGFDLGGHAGYDERTG